MSDETFSTQSSIPIMPPIGNATMDDLVREIRNLCTEVRLLRRSIENNNTILYTTKRENDARNRFDSMGGVRNG